MNARGALNKEDGLRLTVRFKEENCSDAGDSVRKTVKRLPFLAYTLDKSLYPGQAR